MLMKKSELIKLLKEDRIKLDKDDKEYVLENLDLSRAADLIVYYLITKNKDLFRKKYYNLDIMEIYNNRHLFKVLFESNREYIKVLDKIFYTDIYKSASIKAKKEMLMKFLHLRMEYIDKDFRLCYNLFKQLLYNEIREKNDEMVFFLYVPLIFSYLHSAASADELRKFNSEVDRKISKFIKEVMIKKYDIKPVKNSYNNEKKKVGFLIDRALLHSPNNIAKELFKILGSLKEENYEFYILNMEFCDLGPGNERVEELFISMGLRYINFHKKLNCVKSTFYNQVQKALKIREFIVNEKFDILISNGILHPTVHFLFTTRTAPKQIYWSHGNCAIDFEGIDERISHFQQECSEFEWKIFEIPFSKEELVGSEEEKKEGLRIKKRLLEKYGQDTVILGTIGRLVKIDSDEYLKVIAEIMKKNQNTIYLACGSGNNEGIKEKIKKYGIPEGRFIFTGFVNKHVYGWVIDVWPDSFPLRQGQSKNEYIAKGGVVVFMDEYLNDTIRNWYKEFELKDIIMSKDIKSYIKNVNLLIRDKNLRPQISNTNKNLFQKMNINYKKFL